MKRVGQIFIVLFLILGVVVAMNFKKLNLIAGFAAKNVASSVFLANRSLEFTNETDINFSPVNLATITVNEREGVGSVLLKKDDAITEFKVPKRNKVVNTSYYPYGNKMRKDSVFESVNYTVLQKAIDSLFREENKTRSTLIIHKNRIIAEQYADGFDEKSLLLGWSMTKSVLGTLYGILQYHNKINVFDKAPVEAWKDDERKNITIHNLLQMNSGLEWDESYTTISDVTKMLYLEKDMSKSQEIKPLIGKPNESWNYSSGTSNLLSGILRNGFETDQQYLNFWYSGLIDKIGMHSMTIETDMAGNYIASSYSWATTRDWAKLGLLFLNNGNWNGEQIFDKDWVNYATTPTPTSNGEYGATIWLNQGGQLPDVPKNVYHFRGYQGQYVFVLPDHDAVVVRLGLVKDPVVINNFIKEVIKAIES